MARYNIGDKVITTGVWNNGMGILIPKGSIVTVEFDNGKMCRCSIQGQEAWYEYKWLGDVVENGIIGFKKNTNADKIRAMNDEELAEFINGFSTICELCNLHTGCCNVENTKCKNGIFDWLQSEAE